jgi:hypothetical protein
MLMSQLIDPEDLVQLSPRQFEVLQSRVMAELVASPEIRDLLKEHAVRTLGAIRDFTPRTDSPPA